MSDFQFVWNERENHMNETIFIFYFVTSFKRVKRKIEEEKTIKHG